MTCTPESITVYMPNLSDMRLACEINGIIRTKDFFVRTDLKILLYYRSKHSLSALVYVILCILPCGCLLFFSLYREMKQL